MHPHILRVAFAAACAAAGSAGIVPAWADAHAPQVAPDPRAVPQPLSGRPPLGVKHVLIDTVMNSGDGVFMKVPPSTYTKVDSPTLVNCPNAAGCTLELRADIVMFNFGTKGGQGLLVTGLVDGNPMHNGDTFQGEMPPDGSSTTVMSTETLPVALGNHTVETLIFVSGPSTSIANYQLDYSVFKP